MILGFDILCRVSAIGDGPAVLHHPLAEIGIANGTARHNALPAIGVGLLALHRCRAEKIIQRNRGALTASICVAPGLTCLAALGGVDAVQPNAGTVYLDGVTVDDAGLADYALHGGLRSKLRAGSGDCGDQRGDS